ncbi:hypothetical protein KAT92_06425 [Candidatus Babeliales bacterium]|nr:hypothetical protein [Candidatus Babeliales bacterium]
MRTFIWIESTWFKDPEGLPVIMIIARDTETDELVKLGIKDVIPYFYALADEVESETQPVIQSCYGDPIQRVNVTTPDQVPYERSRFLKTFDADILFDMRWLIDHNISYAFDEDLNPVKYDNIYVPRTLFFDIEVRSPPSIIPDPRNPIYPVVIISTCDSWTGEVKVFSWGIPDVQLNDIVIQVKGEDVQIKDVEHIPHKSEHSMFKSWADYIALLDPDIVTAWYGLGFDNPYIAARTRLLKVYIHKQLSRILDQYASEKHWPGRILIDMMEYFKDWSKPMGKFDSYKLKFIAKELLKFEYDNEGGNIDQLFKDQEWEKLLTYSMKDAWVLKALDDHTGLIKFYEGLRKVAGIKFQDTLGRTKLIETLLMRRGIKPMPTRIRHDKEKLKGALVLEPPVGVHTDVGVFDLAQLYPTLIIMYNISPDIDKMIPKVIIEMMAERDKLKQKRLAGKATEAEKTSETSLKYAVNAFYGYMNYMNAKLFKVECARKITKGGRDIARELHKVMEEMGYTPIYGDTDSTFDKGITSPEIGLEIQIKLNEFLINWTTKQGIDEKFAPSIKFEKLYRHIIFKPKTVIKRKRRSKKEIKHEPAKKRYAGHLVWKDGFIVDKLDIVGLEIRRSDSAPFTKQLMEEFLELVLHQNDTEKAIELVKTSYNKVLNGKVPLQEIAIPGGVKVRSNNSARTRGMDIAERELGLNFDSSESPRLLYLLRPWDEISLTSDITEIPMKKVLRPDIENNDLIEIEVPVFEIDWKVMAEKTVEKKMSPFLIAIGSKWENTIGGQKTLFDY